MNYFKNNNNTIFAYDDEQVAQGYGKDLTLITEDERKVLTTYIPTKEEEINIQIAEAKAYLASTDFYMTIDKYAELVEARKVELTTKRAEARDFIRANEIWVDDDSNYEPQDGSGFIRLF